jgi:hypothetical protein
MQTPTGKVIQTILLRLLSLILILSLAWLWVMLAAKPALAQANTILANRDFSNADLAGVNPITGISTTKSLGCR